ncbi:MAG: tRNA epoxyqueuosine(34) reductase QueG [Vallitalea sp.]|jgi:epoxyqueuosine reductase|nr:tRNA epoxyqueuosine(34) reductase QueG [Vallitalea sp.]
MNIKEVLKNYSKEIDIDDIGFCSAKPFYEIKDILNKRDKSNYMCNLESKDYEKKIYPDLTLENAKSFIVILEAYNNNPKKTNTDSLKGNISMAAVSKDYHTIIMDKLKKLEEHLHSLAHCNTKIFVDISPFSDRAIAKRAGLGFIGKNSMLISEKFGSRVFIGYVLTDYYIKPDEVKIFNGCGSCNNCVRSCPAGAIIGNNEINCNICISYLTQHKGQIDNELKKKMGQQIYGCDVCQKVCPYNKVINKDLTNVIDPYPNINDLLSITNKEFKETYGISSSGWRGKKILQRNAIIALGNTNDKEALIILEKYIHDIRVDVRHEVIDSVVRLSFYEGIELLEKMREKEIDYNLTQEIDKAILRLKN